MNHVLFIILTSIALSLGIFAVIVQRGANIVTLNIRVTLMALICALLELGAVCAGYGVGYLILPGEIRNPGQVRVRLIAGILFALIGIHMLVRAFGHRSYVEHRMEQIDIKADTLLCFKLCVQAFIAGTGFGVLDLNLLMVILFIIAAASVFSILGYVSGRAYGAASAVKAYGVGGGMLLILALFIPSVI